MTAHLKPEHSGFKFDNSYAKLASALYQKQRPESVNNPSLLLLNHELAKSLGLDPEVLEKEGAEFLSGNSIYISAEPIAQAYAGHQFGGFNILGDGRAILLGEHITPENKRVDIQLKGSGRTAYSRSGDGRAALGPMLREYIISEAMYALGIPTTRSLTIVTTGEDVYRDDVYPGAVLTRVASSHIRVGTFQFASAIQNRQVLTELADYTINRHFPEIAAAENKYAQLLENVIDLQASLISKWMHVGFIHGVMNTDNVSICGETIDYGPCAFMNSYDPATVFSSIDSKGRYAFGNQAPIAHWNLYRFAEALLPLIHSDEGQAITVAEDLLGKFPTRFLDYWLAGMRRKLGLFNTEAEDLKLAEDLLMYMQKHKADYTNTFRSLGKDSLKEIEIYHDAGFKNWMQQWEARLSRQPESLEQSINLMDQTNPAIIPRNHLVEAALNVAVDEDNFKPLERLLAAISKPYRPTADNTEFMQAPEPGFDTNYKTFCGT
ncbi:MAG TPA: YdiU family protein [Methylotenera sp.]